MKAIGSDSGGQIKQQACVTLWTLTATIEKMPLQDVFIANVRKFRKQKKLTQEKLAELCDSDPHYIGQIENGRRFPSIQFIEKIAAALEQPPYLLFLDNAAETVPPPQFDATDKKALSVYLEEFNDSLHKIVSELNSRYLKKDGD